MLSIYLLGSGEGETFGAVASRELSFWRGAGEPSTGWLSLDTCKFTKIPSEESSDRRWSAPVFVALDDKPGIWVKLRLNKNHILEWQQFRLSYMLRTTVSKWDILQIDPRIKLLQTYIFGSPAAWDSREATWEDSSTTSPVGDDSLEFLGDNASEYDPLGDDAEYCPRFLSRKWN